MVSIRMQTISTEEKHDAVTSERKRARLVVGLLIAAAAIDLVSVWSNLGQVSLLRDIGDGVYLTEAQVAANDARQAAVGGFQLLAVLLTGIAFLTWLHRAYGNLRLLTAREPRFSPGWAVGYWFVPFLNLVRPYTILKEMWEHSGVRTSPDQPYPTTPNPVIVGVWWLAFLAGGIVGNLSGRLLEQGESVDDLVKATFVGAGSDAILVAAAALAIVLVRGIDERQRRALNAPMD